MPQNKGFWEKLKEFWFGKKEGIEFKKTMPPEAEHDVNAFKKWWMGQVMKDQKEIQVPSEQFTQLPEFDFSARKAEAEREFSTQQVPALAEKFASMGKGAVSSSGFAATMGRARAGMTSQLAGLEEQMKQKYALERGGLEAQQAKVGLQRADLQSLIQQRQQSSIGKLGGYAFQPTSQAFLRPSTEGTTQQAARIGAKMASLYFGGGML